MNNNSRKTLFMSDLHLDESEPSVTQDFLKILEQCDHQVDAIYILGDLFEVWIGDDDRSRFRDQIIEALYAVSQRGIPIYLMHGNRDFLLGKGFFRETGCTLLPDEMKIILYGTPVLLMHGDTLCANDVAYLKARKLVRNKWLQRLFLTLPLSLRRRFADSLRAKSMRHKQSVSSEIMDVCELEVARVMRQHQVTHLIHGHTHRPNQHHFILDQQPAIRTVLAAWHGSASMLCWNDQGEVTII